MDEVEEGKRTHDIVEAAGRKVVEQILKEGINPTGLATMFLDQAMGYLDSNIQYCLRNDDPKGALSYLNIFLMDWSQKTSEIQASIKRIEDSLDGTEKDGAHIHAFKLDTRDNKHR